MKPVKKAKVVMIPSNPKNPYVRLLGNSLERNDVSVRILGPFNPLNFAKLFYYRLLGYRILHVHWLYIFPFSWFMKLATFYYHFLGFKIVWEMHNIVAHAGGSKEVLKSRWFYQKCDAIIFHSKFDIMRSMTELNLPEKPLKLVVHHPNYIGVYENNSTREEARTFLGIPHGKKVLLCFGQLRKNRGYEFLLKAIHDIDNVFLIIAGDAGERDTYRHLKEHASNKSIKLIAEWIAPECVQFYFNAADIVVLPYTEITTSGVVPLAYSFARPVIASRIGGLEEIVIAGKTGYLVKPRDHAGLKKAVLDIFQADLDGMGKNAHAFAREVLDWNSAAFKMERLYQQLILN